MRRFVLSMIAMAALVTGFVGCKSNDNGEDQSTTAASQPSD